MRWHAVTPALLALLRALAVLAAFVLFLMWIMYVITDPCVVAERTCSWALLVAALCCATVAVGAWLVDTYAIARPAVAVI